MQTKCIVLNGRPFTTSAAAYEAVNSRSSMWRSRLIWIDYVCINQNDLSEKASQVSQMIDIYRKANKVIVWLGAFDFDITTYLVLDMTHSLLLALARGTTTIQIYKDLMLHRDSIRWKAFIKFWNHAWFTRIWIVQEASIARNLLFSYGGCLFPWSSFTQLAKSFLSTDTIVLYDSTPAARRAKQNMGNLESINQLRLAIEHNKVTSALNSIKTGLQTLNIPSFTKAVDEQLNQFHRRRLKGPAIDKIRLSQNGPIPLLRLSFTHLLTGYGDFEATDARDKIYALRGLVSDPLTPSTAPNYSSRSVKGLYIDLAETIWKSDSPFGAIGWTGIGLPRGLNVPSFVPDWTCPPAPTVPLTSAFYRHEAAGCQYQASGSTLPETLWVSSDDIPYVHVVGVSIDRVKMLGMATPSPEIRNDDDPHFDVKLYCKLQSSWYTEVETMFTEQIGDCNQESFAEMLWRTLVCDRKGTTRPAPPEMREEYETWLRFAKVFPASFSDRTAEPTDEQLLLAKKHVDISWACHMAGGCVGRRFGITEQGRVGMFPSLTTVGDVINIAYGAPTPWVLRKLTVNDQTMSEPGNPQQSDYSLVGECYIYGIMDGELIKSEQQTERFRLC